MIIDIEHILPLARKPSRYMGGEINAACRDWDKADVRWCLAFPDVYEIGMSHIGLSIIHNILNHEEGVIADRVFTPWVDMESVMREHKVPLWGLTTRRPVCEFDILGITLPYELTYTNILTILDLAGIPFYAVERGDNHPLIIGGGVCAFNPEPVAPFFDAIVLGDGENVVREITAIHKKRAAGGRKQDLLKEMSDIRGVYVPNVGNPKRPINRAVMPDIDDAPYPTTPIVPFMQVVHDRVGVEIQRGCTHGCRFCQAGFIYRPVRQRSPGKVKELGHCGIAATGFEELSFLSLSAGDYEALPQVLKDVALSQKDNWTNISLPSLRVETLTPEILTILKRSLHGGFTLAPEAATNRLRALINKGNTEEELLATMDRIFSMGWRQLKLYFMIGLPGETIDDVHAIVDLVHKAMDIGKKYRRDVTITASVSIFVPKAHTPFQWAGQISLAEAVERQNILKNGLRRRGIELKWHNAHMSCLEGVFSRGDRSLAPAIVAAWNRGVRFDAWDEQLKFDIWMEVFKDTGIEPSLYVERRRDLAEVLPWDHLYVELDRDFLKGEYKRALSLTETPDCLNGRCSKCGVCDFKEIEIVRHPCPRLNHSGVNSSRDPMNVGDSRRSLPSVETGGGNDMRLSFTFTKTGPAKWLSHLELMQVFRRAFRRAGIFVRYSEGFHPHMQLKLMNALKVGAEGLNEKGEVKVEAIDKLPALIHRLNERLPTGVRITDLAEAEGQVVPQG